MGNSGVATAPAAVETKDRTLYVCDYCGSDKVYSDASAHWDVDEQDWVLSDTYEYSSCGVCADEVVLERINIDKLAREKPPGTEQAVLVSSVQISNDCYYGPYGIIESDSDEQFHVIKIPETTSEGDLLILKKVNEWQWEIVSE